jgi:peroxiredoxin
MSAKKIYGLLIFFIAFLVVLFFYNKYKVAPAIDMPNLDLVDENGQAFDIKTLTGKKVIISFYASWCPNCIDELEVLNKINAEKLKDVTVLCITDEPIEKLQSFKEKRPYPFMFIKLNKSFHEIGIESIPTVYLLNTKNKIVFNEVGSPDWEDESTLAHLKALME